MPVDMMFGEVLHDLEVVDYDVFIQFIKKDLREPVMVAQTLAGDQRNPFGD